MTFMRRTQIEFSFKIYQKLTQSDVDYGRKKTWAKSLRHKLCLYVACVLKQKSVL